MTGVEAAGAPWPETRHVRPVYRVQQHHRRTARRSGPARETGREATIVSELETKLGLIRAALSANDLGGVRLRGVDWFAWATCGGSNVVILSSETGVAEVLVTADGAWVLTDEIEAARLQAEELPVGLEVWAGPWNAPAATHAFVDARLGRRTVASDRPGAGEVGLPAELVAAKRRLLPMEIDRYRALG